MGGDKEGRRKELGKGIFTIISNICGFIKGYVLGYHVHEILPLYDNGRGRCSKHCRPRLPLPRHQQYHSKPFVCLCCVEYPLIDDPTFHLNLHCAPLLSK
jgi:hypothetical protein